MKLGLGMGRMGSWRACRYGFAYMRRHIVAF